ncbi:hypothetical protein ABFS82_14G129900 [Erythranthe guttata]|uniref:Potassium transporter n=1 Tax=Erythranthe guttata TaxID=4155 RepID=A0A022RNN0_ERYGU|nr:PREDICTED: potassium transporter 5-like [Erythranthe guttata]EYU40530.1 hypothetical protein MIMGU_mgv1a001754mg [Erythranthe guttata]|eukprot:XP_012833698.1 PREDICTED: potassium transporter 5-like [Erythranthe guttata]
MSSSDAATSTTHVLEEEVVTINQDENTPKTLAANKLLRRYDSLDIESAKLARRYHHAAAASTENGGWVVLLQLAFQSIGVVYGDLGTSPLYVFPGVFSNGIKDEDDILGVLSLILYTLTLLPLLKYVFIVLRANDNGDGGTFALYSLICRYAKVGLIPSEEMEDQNVSTFQLELPDNRTQRASKLKSKLENSNFTKYFLLFATMLGTSMLIGDGVLTPCISVLSSMSGLKLATQAMTEDRIVWASVGILIFLFTIQRFGTDKVGYTFAPILSVWFFLISGIGLYNIIKHDPLVIKAINPKYIVDYFRRNQKEAWISLGGVVLSTTGTEALFADVGHFSVRAIQISTCSVVYPSIMLAYTGQASYLRKHISDVDNAFYASVPGRMYWPMFVVAVMASIIASQSLISGTFSIIQQSLSLGCFPRVKVVHTSTKYPGQVYIPEINYLLMLACIFVTLGFRNTTKIGNAYGIAVVFVMALTSAFLVLIMILIWKTHVLLIIAYVFTIFAVELVYLSSVLYKFDQGGYLPLAFAMFLMTIMFVWNDVYRRKYHFELQHKISSEKVKEIVDETNSQRLPGLAIFYSELVHGIPPIFKHYVANVPVLHSILVFVSFKSLPISKVPIEERFLFRRVQPKELQVFRCVVRYGYTDARNEEEPFEKMLVERLKEFIREGYCINEEEESNEIGGNEDELNEQVERDVEYLDKAWRCGVVHLMGEQEVVAAKGANVVKRLLIDYGYNFLKRNLRQTNNVFDIPHKRMLKVGMTYQL